MQCVEIMGAADTRQQRWPKVYENARHWVEITEANARQQRLLSQMKLKLSF
jgi:hypothetical protein